MFIDVYDFDGTIYDGDSTVDLVLFCLRRHPALLTGLPGMLPRLVGALTGRLSLTAFKTALFTRMAARIDLAAESELFWLDARTQAKLGKWFQDTPRDLPVVIASASPEFELRHAAKLLGVDTLIGTRANAETGELIGKNCKGAEKIRRIGEAIGPFTVRAMYTDSVKSDGPLLDMAQEKYLVRHGKVQKLPDDFKAGR